MKVQITLSRNHGHDDRIMLDGLDITKYVLLQGFDLDISRPGLPMLSLTLVPDEIEIDGDIDVLMKRLELESAQCLAAAASLVGSDIAEGMEMES